MSPRKRHQTPESAPAQGAGVLTQKEFADLLGVHRSTVTRWKQHGRLVLDENGLVVVDASRQLIWETQGGRADMVDAHAQRRGRSIPLLGMEPEAFDLLPPPATRPAQAEAARCAEKARGATTGAPTAAKRRTADLEQPDAAFAPPAGIDAPAAAADPAELTATRREYKLALLEAENQQLRLAMDLARGVRYYRQHVHEAAVGLGGTVRAMVERVIDQTAPALAATPPADRARMLDAAVRRLRQSLRWETVRALRYVQHRTSPPGKTSA